MTMDVVKNIKKKKQKFKSNLNWRNLIAGKNLINVDNCESHGKVMRKPELEII